MNTRTIELNEKVYGKRSISKAQAEKLADFFHASMLNFSSKDPRLRLALGSGNCTKLGKKPLSSHNNFEQLRDTYS